MSNINMSLVLGPHIPPINYRGTVPGWDLGSCWVSHIHWDTGSGSSQAKYRFVQKLKRDLYWVFTLHWRCVNFVCFASSFFDVFLNTFCRSKVFLSQSVNGVIKCYLGYLSKYCLIWTEELLISESDGLWPVSVNIHWAQDNRSQIITLLLSH